MDRVGERNLNMKSRRTLFFLFLTFILAALIYGDFSQRIRTEEGILAGKSLVITKEAGGYLFAGHYSESKEKGYCILYFNVKNKQLKYYVALEKGYAIPLNGRYLLHVKKTHLFGADEIKEIVNN